MKTVGSRTLRITLVVLLGISGALLFLLASASANTSLFERHYTWLLGLNLLLAGGMFALVMILSRRLWKRYRAGVFGTRLMFRLVLFFTLVGVLPGALIYVVSAQFLSKSIETWFNVRVDTALESGLHLGRSAMDSMLSDLTQKAEIMARELGQQPRSNYSSTLHRLRRQAGVEETVIVTSGGTLLASAADSYSLSLPELPSPSMLRQVKNTRLYAQIEGQESSDKTPAPEAETQILRMRVVVPVQQTAALLWSSEADAIYLQVLQTVPRALASNALAVEGVYRDYESLSLSRAGLRKIYLATLTLTWLLTIAGALAVAFVLSNWFAAPLLLLAEGTKAIAAGDFARVGELADRGGHDELGVLTQQFRAMTRQLDEAQAGVARNQLALEKAKAFLESILANLSAGVLVFDASFRLTTFNASAQNMIGEVLTQLQQQQLSPTEMQQHAELAEGGVAMFFTWLQQVFSEKQIDQQEEGGVDLLALPAWQREIDLGQLTQPQTEPQMNLTPEQPRVLLVRGSRLPVGASIGYVVVFDDISQVISGQRALAWGEVARRLAHEIKNPLTPIQLAAERLQMKLSQRVEPELAEMVEKTTRTIVNQVSALKHMVDDFREYARTPPAVMQPLDLNALILDILQLYAGPGASPAASSPSITTDELLTFRAGPIQAELARALPLIAGDATQLRQVIHNLLQNALDAIDGRTETAADTPLIGVRTRLRETGEDPIGRVRRLQLVIFDHGPGFTPALLSRAFEPYVTTKARGTGLGLAIVKKILDEHGAQVELQNRHDDTGQVIGARVIINFKV
ncbi:sensor histidine kinase [Parvibium lacunae]|uniref:histidine kinase n=1 Tax=Parvibium lacunae TaxID=1888893 RepID=A0A368KZY3_9BURK|nr:ATP-binding protein [Parvibium lacunae]RCS56856.1 HAMP domain-containing protein [Parvibium lacunae]